MAANKNLNGQLQNSSAISQCPNCWGHLEWAGKYYPKLFNIDRGSNSIVNSRNGFIRKFVKKFIK